MLNYDRILQFVDRFLYPVEVMNETRSDGAKFRIFHDKDEMKNRGNMKKVKLGDSIKMMEERYLHVDELEDELIQTPFHQFAHNFSVKIMNKIDGRFRFPRIMGILNITPDSFFHSSRVSSIEKINSFLSTSPDIVDVGGESTRPTSDIINPEEEQRRLSLFFENTALEKEAKVSIDTRNPSTAEIFSGKIHFINDISGFASGQMKEVAKKYHKNCIVMHMRGTPQTMNQLTHYDDALSETVMFFYNRVSELMNYGISPSEITIDPGIGFAKSPETSAEFISKAVSFNIGVDVLFGTSRKSFMGKITGSNVDERLPETIATSLYLSTKGVDMLRVHDVRENRNALLMLQRLFL
jgi:dihydropteroate synthase